MARLTLSSIFVLTSLLSSYTLLTTATPIDAAAHAMITPAPVLQKRAPGMVKLRCDQKAEDQPAACSAFESAIASYLPGSVYAGLESDYESVISSFVASASAASASIDSSAINAGALLTLLPAADQLIVSAFSTAIAGIRSRYSLSGNGYLGPDDVTFVSDSGAAATATGSGSGAAVTPSTTVSGTVTGTGSAAVQTGSAGSVEAAGASSQSGGVAGFRPGPGLLSLALTVLAGLLV